MATNDVLTESWFIRPVTRYAPAVADVVVEAPRVPKPRGQLAYVIGFGACSGAIGGPLMLLTADAVAQRTGSEANVVDVIGNLVRSLAGFESAMSAALVAVIAAGMVVGTVFGLLTRHALRVPSRVLTGALLAPTLWTLVHAFVFKGGSLGALPFGPMMAGALVFGLCATVLPPPREH